jgi:hypothetical protein
MLSPIFESQDSRIKSPSCGATLPLLFPRLRDCSSEGAAAFQNCRMNSKFLRIFALEVQLSSLSLLRCTFPGSSDEEALACLGKLRGLKALSISLEWPRRLQISYLSELKQLESLALTCCTPVGLNLVLQSTPSLRELYLAKPPGEQIASDSLQTLSIESLSPSSSSFLPLCNLPSLRSISFPNLMLSYSEGGGIDLLKRDILKLASLPLSTLGDLHLL